VRARALTQTNTEEITSKPGSAIIVDDIILFAKSALLLFVYFICILDVLELHRVTVKLKKARFMPTRAEFVGIDVLKEGNSPASSKYGAVRELGAPELFTDLRMLVGFIGFYRQYIPLFEDRIGRWRDYKKEAPNPGSASKEEEAKVLRSLWKPVDDGLLQELKDEILTGPVLKHPDPNRRMYLKTDWSSHAQGAVLLQAGCSEEEEEVVRKEIEGGKCEFEKTLSGLRLRPTAFISQRRQEPSSRHSYVGEASTGRWAMLKFRRFLMGRECTWITDCSGLTKFFESEYEATHTIQRWKLELLRFDFTIVHRPAKMLTECDMLSRYNTWTSQWRIQQKKEEAEIEQTESPFVTLFTQEEINTGSTTYDRWSDEHERQRTEQGDITWHRYNDEVKRFCNEEEPAPIPTSHVNPRTVGPKVAIRTPMAETCDKARTMWIIGTGAKTATTAMTELGLTPLVTRQSEEQECWQYQTDSPDLKTLLTRINRSSNDPTPEWIIVTRAQDHSQTDKREELLNALTKAKSMGSHTMIAVWTNERNDDSAQAQTLERDLEQRGWTTREGIDEGWRTKIGSIRNENHDGYLEAHTTYLITAPKETIDQIGPKEFQPEETHNNLGDILDEGDGIFTDCFQWQR
jgi:hypothetical protein